jgi:hypothetical protein
MVFDEEEQQLLNVALRLYAQTAKRELPTETYAKLVTKVSDINKKIKQCGPPSNVCPPGLTEEQFTKVCQLPCDQFVEGKCIDVVAKKYPGKCDPILRYERQKILLAKNDETKSVEPSVSTAQFDLLNKTNKES